jgi:hypothetical protein
LNSGNLLNEHQLIQSEQNSYEAYPSNKLNRNWLTLMSVMDEIIKSGGANDYKIPHMGKAKLERRNELPTVLRVSDEAKMMLEDWNAVA